MELILLPAITFCLSITPEWFNQCKEIGYHCDRYEGREMKECTKHMVLCAIDGENVNFCKDWISE